MEHNPFISITVTPGYSDGHLIQWRIDPTFYSTGTYDFYVETSGAIDFSEVLNSYPVGDTFCFIDKSNIKQNIQTNYFYRIKLIVDGNIWYSATSAVSKPGYTANQYRIATEIARKEVLRSSKYTGGEFYLLKLKSYGQEGTDETIDPVTGLAMTSGKPNYGISKVNGFYAPIKLSLSIDDVSDIRKLAPDGSGVIENTQLSARVAGFPIIDTNDIVVDLTQDQRWLVKDRQNTPFPGTILNIVQLLKLNLIPPTDPIYSIKIDE